MKTFASEMLELHNETKKKVVELRNQSHDTAYEGFILIREFKARKQRLIDSYKN